MIKTNQSTKLTRRELVRLAGIASIGMSFLMGNSAIAQTTIKKKKGVKSRSAAGKGSVFQENCVKGNSAKYDHYDNNVVYPLLSLWLMFAAGEYDECLKNKDWRTRLASELGFQHQDHVHLLYEITHNNEAPPADNDSEQYGTCTNLQAFNRVKKIWYDFIEANSFYGLRPCPGGATLLQISGIKNEK